MMIGAIFYAGKPRPTSAQNYLSFRVLVDCGDRPNPDQFWYDIKGNIDSMGVAPARCAGNCGGRKVTLKEALAGLPDAVQTGLTTEVNNAAVGKVWCVVGDGKKPLPPGCITRDDERTGDVPWFDPSAAGCNDLQDTQRTFTYAAGKCTVTMRACNTTVLRHTWAVPNSASCTHANLIEENYVFVLPQKVCCDIWREAARAGSGCNPENDADCDGEPNNTSQMLRLQDPYYAPDPKFPDKNFNAADFDPLPPGLNWDAVMPNEPCKGCKWMATSAKLTCSPDKNKRMPESAKKDHEYKVTWKCPMTGVVKVVTKKMPARFACTPPTARPGSSRSAIWPYSCPTADSIWTAFY
jgi:hypothetical protein